MRAERATLLTLGAAIVLPLVLFAALFSAFALNDQRGQIETEALARAHGAATRVDGALLAEKSALEVLSQSRAMRNHEWDAVLGQVQRVAALRPQWKNVILTDAQGARLFALAPSSNPAADASIAAYLSGGASRFQVDSMAPGGPGCPCLTVHSPVFEDGRLAEVLTLQLDPRPFQDILMSTHKPGGVSAIVTHDGRFIARTADFEKRVGQLSTPYVRDAMAKGRSGLYRGKTWEGFDNYTAYETSPVTGLSTHVAIGAEQLNDPRRRFFALMAIAGLTALTLAAAIGGYGLWQRALRRREEEGRRQAQKLEAIGQLAGGVAHDFNNLLAVIIGNLERLTKTADDKTARPLANALAAAQRGSKLTQQLLAFTRVQGPEIERVDLSAVVDGVRDLIAQSVGPGVAVSVEIAPDARFVRSNADELELALLNLAVNARDAMPDGGSIEIRALRAAETVRIEVQDTGPGIPPHVAEKAFDPFFTTKPPGKGTGLGLAQVKRLAVHSQGTVEIKSEPGKGALVVLTLPAA